MLDYPGGGPNAIARVFIRERGRQRVRERGVMTESEVGEMQWLALKMEGPLAKECGRPLEARKQALPLELPAGTQPCLTP